MKDGYWLVLDRRMVFHLLRSGWKHLGHFNHCQKEKITDNHKFVHSFWWWPICVYICVADKCDYGVRITFTFFFRDVSSMGLIAMVAERYIAIAHSLKYVRVFTTTRRTFMIIAICWVIPFLFNAFFLSKASIEKRLHFFVIYTVLFELLPAL